MGVGKFHTHAGTNFFTDRDGYAPVVQIQLAVAELTPTLVVWVDIDQCLHNQAMERAADAEIVAMFVFQFAVAADDTVIETALGVVIAGWRILHARWRVVIAGLTVVLHHHVHNFRTRRNTHGSVEDTVDGTQTLWCHLDRRQR
ncbi:hypothetical protein D3C78_1525220 [compost metagenome]